MFPRVIILFLSLCSMAHAAIVPGAIQAHNATTDHTSTLVPRAGRLKERGPGPFMWAQFCDDDNCGRCGKAVNMGNPGCLSQRNRRSIRLHGDIKDHYQLVVSPGDLCSCQVRCEQVNVEGPLTNVELARDRRTNEYCWNIAAHGYDQALSFRWVSRQMCDPNQCNWDGTPL